MALSGWACLAHGDLELHECKAHRLPHLRRKCQPEAPASASFSAAGCRTEARMRQSFFDYCRLYQKQNLLDEWDAGAICRSRRRQSPMAVTNPHGGGAKTGTNGRRRSIPEATAPAAPTAQGGRLWWASTTSPRNLRSWRGNGIMRKKCAACSGGHQCRKS